MALVAHLLHTPVPMLTDYTANELVELAEVGIEVVKGLYGDGRN